MGKGISVLVLIEVGFFFSQTLGDSDGMFPDDHISN